MGPIENAIESWTIDLDVSIQLIAPASGAWIELELGAIIDRCFHSTDCPSEWGLGLEEIGALELESFPFN